MPQVRKEEIFDRIFQAGIEVFYEKDFRSAKMQQIALKANIPVGLIYTYFKNKESLFEKIVSSFPIDFQKIAREEESASGLPSEKYKKVTESYLLNILEHHKIFVILIDKSFGTKYQNTKEEMIEVLGKHIKTELGKKAPKAYNDLFVHILATNFAESLLEIARHYKNQDLAKEMLSLVTQCYYEGVNSL